jgi:phenylpropionate dioxygenase-like ring-hydroxylating dioxygenase large terminal subunit
MLLTQEPVLRRFWYPVAFSAAVTDRPIQRTVLGETLVVWRTGDGVAAAPDRCPHREARLSQGWLCDGHLVCPYHGWEFDGAGALARIPQLEADAALPPKGNLATVRCTERLGWVWVCLDDDPLGGIPELPEYGADGWRVVPEYEWMFECSAAHLIENNIDPAHIAFVHRGTFGAGQDPKLTIPSVERVDHGLVLRARVPVAGRHGDEGPTERITTTELWGPFLGVFRIGYADGLEHIMLKACTPEADGRTRLLQQVIRNDAEEDRPGADIIAFDDKWEAEDQSVLDGLPAEYPLEPTAQVHTKFDRPALELRRFYKDLVTGSWTPAR